MIDAHGIIFAQNTSPQLKELTRNRTIASIPFGGRYRIIDFMLSSMVNAGVPDVGVIVQDNYQSLQDHLGTGRDWDLSRKLGGLRMLPPFGYGGSAGCSVTRSKIEALSGISNYLGRTRQQYVILADGDLIANLPLEQAFLFHVQSGSGITAVCTRQNTDVGSGAVTMLLDENNRVTDITSGSKTSGCTALGVYILEKELLLWLISHCMSHGLENFERDILQRRPGGFEISGWIFEGYAAKPDNCGSYFKHSMELLKRDVRGELFNRSRPVMTKVRDETSAYYGPDSMVGNCLVADGCYIEGEVVNSILFRGVRIDKGARVSNCILMQDTHICSGANLSYTVADKDVTINRERMLMGHALYPIVIEKESVI
jgi:glucose-1-phosphate adenylyltransferase